MPRLYFYPSAPSNDGYDNPYCSSFKRAMGEYYDVMEADNRRPHGNYVFMLLRRAFQADVFVLNWLESNVLVRDWKKPLRIINAVLALLVMRLRGKQIVWTFHNMHPHLGQDVWTRLVERMLYRFSTLIIAHSQQAADFVWSRAKRRAHYISLPINEDVLQVAQEAGKHPSTNPHTVFIWGTVSPYKGVVELLSDPYIRESGTDIHILGRATSPELSAQIHALCNEHITFDERRAPLSEIAAEIVSSRFVLMPYTGDCVSSSGILVDTLAMGGMPVGPDVGAFHDFNKLGVCLTYKTYKELALLLASHVTIRPEARKCFIEANSWPAFANFFHQRLEKRE